MLADGTRDAVVDEPLESIIHTAHALMASQKRDNLAWRRFYTEACVLRGLAALRQFHTNADQGLALDAIRWFDHAIIVAGAPGQGRLELLYDLIERVQTECFPMRSYNVTEVKDLNPLTLTPELNSAKHSISHLEAAPSLSAFTKNLFQRPFILSRFVQDWPAFNERPWRSIEYLRFVAGPGRVVPVEIGSDYRDDDWTQQIMPWDDFLEALHPGSNPQGTEARPMLYLAQHDLLKQFPRLRDDIIVPDYVYGSLESPADFPGYKPPQNNDQLVVNAWLGPAGTVSPAHTVGNGQLTFVLLF